MQIASTDTWANHGSGKSFSTTSGATNTITSAGDLAQLAINVNAGTTYSGVNFKQTANINLGGYDWVPIGNENLIDNYLATFGGNYDGQNYKIEGLTINTTEDVQGLFGHILGKSFTNSSKISNIDLRKGRIIGGRHVGAIVGRGDNVEIYNCKNAIPIDGKEITGGIVGNAALYYVGVNKCVNTASIYVSGDAAGGIVGNGIACNMENCLNYGDVFGNNYVGGIVGRTEWNVSNSISDCTITGTGDYVGGLIGLAAQGTIVTCCAVYGHIMYLGTNANNCHAIGVDQKGTSTCSFYGTCNLSATEDFLGEIRDCRDSWILCNGKMGVSSDLSSQSLSWTQDWAIVPNMNDGLPIQKELYAVASAANSTLDELQAAFRNHGFDI